MSYAANKTVTDSLARQIAALMGRPHGIRLYLRGEYSTPEELRQAERKARVMAECEAINGEQRAASRQAASQAACEIVYGRAAKGGK